MMRFSKYSELEPFWRNENMKTIFLGMNTVFPDMVIIL